MPATQTLRFADPDTARRYPLAVQGSAAWQHQDGAWRLVLSLPELQPGTILVPSLALSGPGHRYHWTLRVDDGQWPLPEVPCAQQAPQPAPGGAVSTHIDCYHIHRRLQAPQLHLAVVAPEQPERYLACASSRALTLGVAPLPERSVALSRLPKPRSQMTAPGPIAQRICSPTCVSMVLELWDKPHDWLSLAAECHDPSTGLYGVWPLALEAAARRNCLGAVEVFERWEEPLEVLARGVPMITSIRFSKGELPGAPLEHTGGHLVVVHGVTPEEIRVCDPAAAADEAVQRVYPADAFSKAWLRHRGAAYILPP